MKHICLLKNYIFAGTYVFVLCVFLLAPFDFHFPFFGTAVKWLSETNGVQITSTAGIRSSLQTDRLYKGMVSGDGITVEVWVATKDMNQKGPARIASYSLNKSLRNFTLGQEGRALVMRLRTTDTDLNGRNPDLIVPNVFDSSDPQHVLVTYDFSEEKVYINGQSWLRSFSLSGRFTNWEQSYPLVLANEATGNRPWRGNLFLVAIYNRPLSDEEIRRNYEAGWFWDRSGDVLRERVADGLVVFYAFDKGAGKTVFDQSGTETPVNLQILSGYEILNKEFLSPPYKNFRLTFRRGMEVMFNIIIFIPFGFLMHAAARRRYGATLRLAAYILAAGIVFTLGIESIQYFSITRNSSMTDMIHNFLGTGLGITFEKASPFLRRRWSEPLRDRGA